MARKVEIPKEKILQSGLEMIIGEGWSAISINTLAKKVGCSTQPIAWHFGSMDKYRQELAAYALNYVNGKMKPQGNDPMEDFLKIGSTYLDMAYDEPNLVRFLQGENSGSRSYDGIGFVFSEEKIASLAENLAPRIGITAAQSYEFIQTSMLYTHGLVSMVVSGAFPVERERARNMIKNTGTAYLVSVGISREKAEKLFSQHRIIERQKL